MQAAPTVLGFDARIQFVDISDGVEVIRRMVVEDHPGTFNVTGRGAMFISQCLRRGGRAAVPMPPKLFATVADLGRGAFPDVTRDQRDLLKYGRVGDGAKLDGELNWSPRRTTAEAFHAFAPHARLAPSPAAVVAAP